MINLYEVLGIAPQATAQHIKSAYWRLAREHHPDLQGNDLVRSARFQQIQSAYEVLIDAKRRAVYDEQRRLWMVGQGAMECSACGAANRVATQGSSASLARCARCKTPLSRPVRSPSKLTEQFYALWNEVGEEMSALAADGVRAGFAYLRHRYGIARGHKTHPPRNRK